MSKKSLENTIYRLTELVEDAKKREVELNRHLGYPDDWQKGSLSLLVRWDDIDLLLKTLCQEK
jgi:hypothetical protein